MTKHDPSLAPESLLGSPAWAAQRLGMSKTTFWRKLENMQAEGFPEIDPLTNLYVKQDIDAWIERRRRITNETRPNLISGGINYEEL